MVEIKVDKASFYLTFPKPIEPSEQPNGKPVTSDEEGRMGDQLREELSILQQPIVDKRAAAFSASVQVVFDGGDVLP